MMRRLGCLALILAMPSVAFGEQPDAQASGSPLCVWEIYATMLAYTEVCHVDGGSDGRAALDEAVVRLEAFIKENSDIQQSQLDGRKATLRSKPNLCDASQPDSIAKYYESFSARQSADEFRAWIAKYTSAPRDPNDGDCL